MVAMAQDRADEEQVCRLHWQAPACPYSCQALMLIDPFWCRAASLPITGMTSGLPPNAAPAVRGPRPRFCSILFLRLNRGLGKIRVRRAPDPAPELGPGGGGSGVRGVCLGTKSERKAGLLLLGWKLHILGKAEGFEGADDHPGRVQLPPLQAVAG